MNFKFNSHFFFSLFFLSLFLIWTQSIYNPLFVWNELLYHFESFDLRGLAKGTIFIVSYLLALIPFMLLIKLKSFRVFFFFLSIIYIFFSIDFFVQLLGISHGFSIDEQLLAMHEMGNYKYLLAYLPNLFKSLGLSFLVVLLLYFLRKKVCIYKNLQSRYLMFTLFSMLIIYGACYKMDTFKLSSYPAPIKIPLIMIESQRISEPVKDRLFDETLTVSGKKRFKNIIWIVDESVTGTYLSLNGYEKDTTPYLRELDKTSDKIYNFGVVNSISNCSAQSNLFLRIGLNPKKYTNLKKEMFDLPTIFEYAKKAGYETWLFDSQTKKDYLQNYLTLYDKSDIDHFETLGSEVERVDRDNKFLEQYSKIVNSKEPNKNNFIIVVKYGSHFPYLLTYNHEYTPFKPVMEVSYGGIDLEHKEELMNTYLNSIYSSTDLYLKNMFSKVDLSKNIVFYTSDHGQNILEVSSLTRTHCNSEIVVKNEVSVPLMVFNKDAKKLFSKNQNLRYSQIQLFPTTLSLFGYDKKVVDKYGKTLFEGYNEEEERIYILSSSVEAKIYK